MWSDSSHSEPNQTRDKLWHRFQDIWCSEPAKCKGFPSTDLLFPKLSLLWAFKDTSVQFTYVPQGAGSPWSSSLQGSFETAGSGSVRLPPPLPGTQHMVFTEHKYNLRRVCFLSRGLITCDPIPWYPKGQRRCRRGQQYWYLAMCFRDWFWVIDSLGREGNMCIIFQHAGPAEGHKRLRSKKCRLIGDHCLKPILQNK